MKALTQEEINEMILKAKAGEEKAKSEIIEYNMGLINSIAAKYVNSTSLEFADLFQEGAIGLLKAVEKFDVSKGYRFSTYATWWIRQAIQRAINDCGKTIKIPVYVQEDIQRINKAKKILIQELNTEPTAEDIYKKIKIDFSWFDKIVNHEFFNILVDLAKSTEDANNPELMDVEISIMEDLDFSEEAELICNKIIKFIIKKKQVPKKEVISERVNLSKARIAELMSYENNISYFDQKISENSENCFGDFLVADDDVEAEMDKKMLSEGLAKAIDEIYGKEYRNAIEKVKKLNIQIDYLKNKKKINLEKELLNLDKNKNLSDEDKQDIKVLLERFVKKEKEKDVSELIEKLEKQKETAQRNTEIHKGELLMRRFGICGYQKETLDQLGERFGRSRERIRQIEKTIISGETENSKLLMSKILEYCNLTKDNIP